MRKVTNIFLLLILLWAFSINVFSQEDLKKENNQKSKICLLKFDVEFLKSGEIGNILPKSNTCEEFIELQQKAIDEAKKIEFFIATLNGEIITITKTVEFDFEVFENDKIEPKIIDVRESLVIVEKPKAGYPKPDNGTICVTGVVRVRVAFLSTGQIGGVAVVSGLPYGITEKAIEAAKKIKFIPARKNGVQVSINKVVAYNFSLY